MSFEQDEEKRKINNKIMTAANPKLMATNSTLCWLCRHCTGSCPKSYANKPIPGWKVEDSDVHPGKAVCVKECPLFDFNYDLRWDMATVMPLLKHWCKTKSGKELYYNAVKRDPAFWVDEYNSKMPRHLQIDPVFDEEDKDTDIDLPDDLDGVLLDDSGVIKEDN